MMRTAASNSVAMAMTLYLTQKLYHANNTNRNALYTKYTTCRSKGI